jgi:hypothetical protein
LSSLKNPLTKHQPQKKKKVLRAKNNMSALFWFHRAFIFSPILIHARTS